MLQEIETHIFTLTPAASEAVRNILEERKLEGYALRVYVAGGGCGCSGVNFGMALDNNIRDVDTTFDANGVKVVVDNVSIDYLREATIDFINDPRRGAGFSVNSPSVQRKSHEQGGCGCGGHESQNESESCCGGGGSCSCN